MCEKGFYVTPIEDNGELIKQFYFRALHQVQMRNFYVNNLITLTKNIQEKKG